MNKGKSIIMLISVLVLFCALVFVAYKLFQVRVIRVSGCTSLEEQEVAALSGIEYGQCIFFVDTEAAIEALAADPFVKPVSVKVDYPYSVEITIEERKPAAYVDTDSMRLTLDSEGVLLMVDMSPQGEALPQVSGLSTARFEVGQPLGDDAYKRSVLSKLLSALLAGGFDVTHIDLAYASALEIDTQEGYVIELGDESQMEAKLALARYVMEEMTQQGKTGGTIDVSTAEKAYFREN